MRPEIEHVLHVDAHADLGSLRLREVHDGNFLSHLVAEGMLRSVRWVVPRQVAAWLKTGGAAALHVNVPLLTDLDVPVDFDGHLPLEVRLRADTTLTILTMEDLAAATLDRCWVDVDYDFFLAEPDPLEWLRKHRRSLMREVSGASITSVALSYSFGTTYRVDPYVVASVIDVLAAASGAVGLIDDLKREVAAIVAAAEHDPVRQLRATFYQHGPDALLAAHKRFDLPDEQLPPGLQRILAYACARAGRLRDAVTWLLAAFEETGEMALLDAAAHVAATEHSEEPWRNNCA
jgi:hypothetical protein